MELSVPCSANIQSRRQPGVFTGGCLADLQAIHNSNVSAVLVRSEQRSRAWDGNMESVAREILSVMKGPLPVTIGKDDDPEIAVAEFDSELDLTSEFSHAFYRDMVDVVRAFQRVVQSDEIGLRLDTVDSDNCANFHVDFVPLRVVMTLLGPGTQWLANESVDRKALAERRFAEIRRENATIERVGAGDVLLMKGEGFLSAQGERNVGNGFVHRSPPKVTFTEPRLLLRIDEISERQQLNIGRF